ncbi:MAG: sulfite exporter TauE/SafE family protein [Elusimicrobia bacterium]|nr:sulfite exporter TauE/SafE family protein [Elusimicrobiota bacterium]
MEFLLLIVFGFPVGVIASVFGIGGGIFIVPFLVLLFKLSIHQAIAASLLAIVATSSAVASVNVEKGLTNLRVGIVLETATALGSIFGAVVSSILPSETAQLIFSIILFPVAGLMFVKGKKTLRNTQNFTQEIESGAWGDAPAAGKFDSAFFDPSIFSGTAPMARNKEPLAHQVSGAMPSDPHVPTANTVYKVKNMFPASLISFFAGSLSGLLGIGGGIVQVPVMNLLCKMPMKAAAATSNFIIGVSACASAIIFFRNGFMPARVASAVVIGVILGSVFGVRALYKTKPDKIQAEFSLLVFVIGIVMLFKTLYA